jgi:radical SAM superfamily enzyme YgiQ (UPF0313 family)
MKALLIYPTFPETFWSFKSILKFISRKAAFPPLGLLTVASMMPDEWDMKLVDMNVKDLKEEDLLWADVVFISAMFVQRESAREVVDWCKSLGKKTVAGGPLFTTGMDNFMDIDHILPYETENTFPQFLRDLESGDLQHIYYPTDRPEITKTPVPRWSLIRLRDYATMAIQFSRGCPFNCEFCDIIVINGRQVRTKSPEQMLTEFNALQDHGWKDSVFVVDDNFIGNKANVKRLLPELIKWQQERNYPFKLFTQASTNLADDEELMQMMSTANFFKVFLGIETPSVDSLKECSKLQNATRDIESSVKVIHQHGMQVMGGFIVGFDSDTESIFETQKRFIQQIGVVAAMVGILTAMPQTRLWKRLKEEGRLLHESNGDVDGTCNFIPKMDRDTLVNGYRQLLATIYSPSAYYKRINVFIKSYKHTVRGPIGKDDIRALLKSTWEIGVLSRARLHYWMLLLRTTLTKASAVPVAIELAIYGEHFQNFARNVTCSLPSGEEPSAEVCS